MKNLVRLTAACGALVLASCNVSRPSTGVPEAIPQVSLAHTEVRGALLYVADPFAGDVQIFSYPSLKPFRTLSGLNSADALCVNPKTGDVWVTEAISNSQIVEFAHGGMKPIKTLQDRGGPNIGSCAVSPAGTHVAITNRATDDPGDVVIFDTLTGKSKEYFDKNMFDYAYLGYDPSGNLFVDGSPRSFPPRFVLDELPSGKNKLVDISWHGPKIQYPAGVQYDGNNVAVGSSRAVIYQTDGGKIIGKTTLRGACGFRAYFIEADRVVVPSDCSHNSTVSIYRYPAGGAAIQTISGFKGAAGVVVSN